MIHSQSVPFRWWVWWVLSTTILPAQRALFLYIASNLDVGFGVSRLSSIRTPPIIVGPHQSELLDAIGWSFDLIFG